MSEPAEPAQSAGRDRLATVLADFFLDPAERLTEQERALMGGLLDGLVGWIADEIRGRLGGDRVAANDGDRHSMRERLATAGLLQRADLVGLLLRRADEERIAGPGRTSYRGATPFLQGLIASKDADVSAAAMELILARGRRRDRFGQPRLELDDLPLPLARSLAFGVAAALKPLLQGGSDDADRQLSEAASELVARHDPDKGSTCLSRNLVQLLSRAGLLDDENLSAMLREGDVLLLVEALAVRAGTDSATAWAMVTAGSGGRLVGLLRDAGVQRRFAAEMLALVGEQLGIGDPAEEIARFDSSPTQDAASPSGDTRLAADYRRALDALEAARG